MKKVNLVTYETAEEMAVRHKKEKYALTQRYNQEMKDIHIHHERESAQLVTVRMILVKEEKNDE